MKVGFLGLGKLGLPVALAVESKGHYVCGTDISKSTIENIKNKKIAYKEIWVDDYLKKTSLEIFDVQNVVKNSDIIFVPIQTPHEEKYEGIDSKELLVEVMGILNKKGFEVNNIDVTVLLQKPKLRNHIDNMIETLSTVMKIDKKKLSIKATTTEGLGFVGREEGVAAHCVTLINKI